MDQPINLEGSKILLVDDMPANLSLLRTALEPKGYRIMAARDGQTALEIVRYEVPDLILLDVMMPDISGFECCRRLKGEVATRDIPIIFVTGKNEVEDMKEGFASGGNDYITKPFQIEEVLARLMTHLTVSYLFRRLRASNDELECRVEERTARFELANQALLAENLERKKLEATRLKLLSRLVNAQEKERFRIAAELHDGVGQNLLIMINRADMRSSDSMAPEAALERLKEIHGFLEETARDVWEISYDLRPFLLEKIGLTKAIKSMVEMLNEASPIDFSTDLDSVDDLFKCDVEVQLYRIAQECLNNIVKHSQASAARLEIRRTEGLVTITVTDDGCGFDWNAQTAEEMNRSGFGLIGMTDRLRLMGGRLDFQSAPGEGTRLRFDIAIEGCHSRPAEAEVAGSVGLVERAVE